MASFTLPARYQSYLGTSFFQRQIKSVADALPGVIKRGLSTTPTAPAPANPGLPDVSAIDKPKSNVMLYAGIGVAAVLALTLLKRRKAAPATA